MTRYLLAFLLFAFPAVAQIGGNGGGINGNAYLPLTGGTITGALTAPTVNVTGSANGTLNMSYTTSSAPSQYGEVNSNGTFNWPISAAGGCCRLHYWSDNVTVTGNQTGINVVEANFFNLIISGTGTLTNEAFNIIHPYVYIPSGVTISGYAENFEASALNEGTISGAIYGGIALYTNDQGTTGVYAGLRVTAVNNNSSAGSFGAFEGLECAGVTGSGSKPTYNWCIANRDSSSTIASLGGVVIGTLANANASGTLYIQGPDNAGGTYPFFVKNASLANIFGITDAGGATLYLGDFVVSTGSVNATAYKINGTLGATCSGTPSSSFATSYGIVTHC